MLDQTDNLIITNPVVRVEDECVDPFLQDRCIERPFHILDCLRVIWGLHVLGFPVARHGAGELPTTLTDHIRVGVIFNRVDE